ncbi:MAG: hypothetical protein MZV63_21475 [Marinilabiliales bacterium]|nr:hypothetical protein [Marinilabiliales bacterium]
MKTLPILQRTTIAVDYNHLQYNTTPEDDEDRIEKDVNYLRLQELRLSTIICLQSGLTRTRNPVTGQASS